MQNPLEYPKTYEENLRWRAEMLDKCSRDSMFLAAVRELFYKDVLFAFNGFFYTLDVRKRPRHNQPFCTYEDYQDKTILDIVGHINGKRDLVLEKSRDMGASWMVIGSFFWVWLNPAGGGDFLLGSRIEDYVDKAGDMRTLIQKARYLLYRLPPWLLPDGFNRNKHDNFMRLLNPETGATITGESNNANFSTGGRYAAVLFDEFAKWETTDTPAWTAAGDATPCRIAISTPFGAAGRYYDLITDGFTDKITLHWSRHPEKSDGMYCPLPKPEDAESVIDQTNYVGLRSPWYDKECERRSDVEVAQELDIDYIGAGHPVFDGKAGKRISTLLKSDKRPEAIFELIGSTLIPFKGVPNTHDGLLVAYELPKEKHGYTMGVDVCEGREEGDYSIIKVYDRVFKTVVATYARKIDEVQLAGIIKGIYDLYREPWTGIETNGPGLATFDLVSMNDVTNLFMMPKYDAATQTHSYIKGWRTHEASRNMLIAGIREWLVEESGWCDLRCVREMTTFVRDKNGKPQAKSGCHDDEVIALGIAIQVDFIAPEDDFPEARSLRADGLPDTLFEIEEHKLDEDKVETFEDVCFAQAIANQAEVENQRAAYGEFFETFTGEYYEDY